MMTEGAEGVEEVADEVVAVVGASTTMMIVGVVIMAATATSEEVVEVGTMTTSIHIVEDVLEVTMTGTTITVVDMEDLRVAVTAEDLLGMVCPLRLLRHHLLLLLLYVCLTFHERRESNILLATC